MQDSSLDENEDDSFDELAKLREQMQLDSPQGIIIIIMCDRTGGVFPFNPLLLSKGSNSFLFIFSSIIE